jgi:PE family
MSYVIADPQMMTSAASDLAAIGSNVDAAHMVAAAPTTSVIPAAADEVSAGIAQLFSQHAANYQALAGQAAAFHEQFVQNLTAGAFSFASIEASIAGSLSTMTGLPFSWLATLSPQQFLLALLGLPIEIFTLSLGQLYLRSLPPSFLPIDSGLRQ